MLTLCGIEPRLAKRALERVHRITLVDGVVDAKSAALSGL